MNTFNNMTGHKINKKKNPHKKSVAFLFDRKKKHSEKKNQEINSIHNASKQSPHYKLNQRSD